MSHHISLGLGLLLQIHVRYYIARDQDKVILDYSQLAHLTEGITSRKRSLYETPCRQVTPQAAARTHRANDGLDLQSLDLRELRFFNVFSHHCGV